MDPTLPSPLPCCGPLTRVGSVSHIFGGKSLLEDAAQGGEADEGGALQRTLSQGGSSNLREQVVHLYI